MTDQVLDKETWPLEAEAALNDVRKHVKEALIAPGLRSTNQKIYLKITTYEDEVYTVEMSASGFSVVASTSESNKKEEKLVPDREYETLYALLDNISQRYRQSFGAELTSKLRDLERKRQV